ncbi:MAG: glycosyltransferase family 2 protein [Lachnospiraceae bacterium]|nr:glycosyltransferase family 2 protein [Lachnospiraceae bacterium]MDN4742084.1 glycosyltransferase family 2 protein [Lachnospiraceae bacterium C1.1]
MDKLYMVIPAYNEEESIRDVIDEWYPMVVMTGEDSRLVVIDDGSKDRTLEVLKAEAEKRSQLIVKHKENSGHGPTILAGYRYALKEGADYIFQTDSDGQTRPEEFPAFWRCRRHYDMIVGYRNHRQDGWSRIFVTKVLKAVIFLCFHCVVTDANTPFRLMKAETLEKEIHLIPKNYFLTNVLITVIYTKHRRAVKFTPITFRARQGGVNSINMKRIFGIGKNALRDFIMLNKKI